VKGGVRNDLRVLVASTGLVGSTSRAASEINGLLAQSGEHRTVHAKVRGSKPLQVAISLAYSLLGEGTRLLTEMKVGSNPTMPASFAVRERAEHQPMV
jgi:hypothetical protein